MFHLFRPQSRQASEKSERAYAVFELFYTIADFTAAVLFIIGSILFFYDAFEYAGTWFFLVGSILFAAKPALRLAREIYLYRLGDLTDLAHRIEGEFPNAADKRNGSDK